MLRALLPTQPPTPICERLTEPVHRIREVKEYNLSGHFCVSLQCRQSPMVDVCLLWPVAVVCDRGMRSAVFSWIFDVCDPVDSVADMESAFHRFGHRLAFGMRVWIWFLSRMKEFSRKCRKAYFSFKLYFSYWVNIRNSVCRFLVWLSFNSIWEMWSEHVLIPWKFAWQHPMTLIWNTVPFLTHASSSFLPLPFLSKAGPFCEDKWCNFQPHIYKLVVYLVKERLKCMLPHQK